MLTTRNSSGVVEGLHRIDKGEIMAEKLVEIEAVRNFAVHGKHIATGKTVKVDKRTANYLIGIGKARQPETAMLPPGRAKTTAGNAPVTAIEGVGPGRTEAMSAIGINTVAQLAGWAPADLAEALSGVSETVADDLISKAQELLTS